MMRVADSLILAVHSFTQVEVEVPPDDDRAVNSSSDTRGGGKTRDKRRRVETTTDESNAAAGAATGSVVVGEETSPSAPSNDPPNETWSDEEIAALRKAIQVGTERDAHTSWPCFSLAVLFTTMTPLQLYSCTHAPISIRCPLSLLPALCHNMVLLILFR